MAVATVQGTLNLWPPTVPPASQVVQSGPKRTLASASMAAAIAKDGLNLGHHTVPPASQVARIGPNRTPASASMAAATAKGTMQVGSTAVSRMRLVGARHGSRQEPMRI